jgi:hypothetical protein
VAWPCWPRPTRPPSTRWPPPPPPSCWGWRRQTRRPHRRSARSWSPRRPGPPRQPPGPDGPGPGTGPPGRRAGPPGQRRPAHRAGQPGRVLQAAARGPGRVRGPGPARGSRRPGAGPAPAGPGRLQDHQRQPRPLLRGRRSCGWWPSGCGAACSRTTWPPGSAATRTPSGCCATPTWPCTRPSRPRGRGAGVRHGHAHPGRAAPRLRGGAAPGRHPPAVHRPLPAGGRTGRRPAGRAGGAGPLGRPRAGAWSWRASSSPWPRTPA